MVSGLENRLMKARLMTAGTICILALAAFAVAPQISAQSGSTAGKGIFSTLKVGQMVEYTNDAWGSPVVYTYEDEVNKPRMRHKVKEVGHDFLALEFDDREASGATAELRISAHRLSLLSHVGKTHPKGSTGDDPLIDKPGSKTNTKPGTTKKKN
jgi:hypothetical protein